MPAALTTRRLTTADTDGFRALFVEALRLHPTAFWSSPEEENAVSAADAAKRMTDTYVVGGFRDGALAGFALYMRREEAKLRHKGMLALLYVRPAARGSGLADALMQHVVEIAAGEVEELLLNVSADNQRARRFYERWGFAVYGQEPRCLRLPSGDYVDEQHMAKPLCRPPAGRP